MSIDQQYMEKNMKKRKRSDASDTNDETKKRHTPSKQSEIISVSATAVHHPRNLSNIKDIVVFGDSYSKHGPGLTWVDFVLDLLPSRVTQLHNFAMIGATAKDGFEPQLERFFHEFPAKTKDMPAPNLDSKTTLYAIWFGINDCGSLDAVETVDEIVETLFDHLDRLYLGAGARNFVLLDVPSLDRSPGALDLEISSEIRERCNEWNEAMKSGNRDFSKISKEANMILFSSESFLSNILDSPEDYGFEEADTCLENGVIWVDELHLATEVHRLLAKELIQALDTKLRNAA